MRAQARGGGLTDDELVAVQSLCDGLVRGTTVEGHREDEVSSFQSERVSGTRACTSRCCASLNAACVGS